MQKKQALFNPKGMNRDLAVSAFNPLLTYENKNIRTISVENNSTLSITNEKGNTKISIEGLPDGIKGEIIGECTINSNLILFSTDGDFDFFIGDINIEESNINNIAVSGGYVDIGKESYDRIYKVVFTNKSIEGYLLYEGDLNFNINNPIESLGIYETESIQKVYWVDGINLLRYINISANNPYPSDRTFDIVSKVNTNAEITITKYLSGGTFPAGVIQYAFSYYRKNGEETPLIKVSPILYLSNDSGISPDTSCNNSFKINISNIDSSFDYVRIYSIVRTSLDSLVLTKIVKDIKIINNSITFIDNGAIGRSVDSSYLLFLDKTKIYPETLTTKDNTLFIGNLVIPTNKLDISKDILKSINLAISPQYKVISFKDLFNNYTGLLNNNASKVSTFKWDEDYLLGLLFKDSYGNLSEVVPLELPIRLNLHNNISLGPEELINYNLVLMLFKDETLEGTIWTKLYNAVKDKGYNLVRMVIANPTFDKRRVVCLGILNPTLFRLGDRISNSPYSLASWITRYAGHHGEQLATSDSSKGEIQSLDLDTSGSYILRYTSRNKIQKKVTITYKYKIFHKLSSFVFFYSEENGNLDAYSSGLSSVDKDIEKYIEIKKKLEEKLPLQFHNNTYIPTIDLWKSYTSESVDPEKTREYVWNKSILEVSSEDISIRLNNYYIDESILTLNTPDIENIIPPLEDNMHLRIIGILDNIDSVSNYLIQGSERAGLNSIGEVRGNFKYLKSNLLWLDSYINTKKEELDWLFATYMWHRSGSLNADGKSTADKERKSVLKSKIFLNSTIARNVEYLKDTEGNNTVWSTIPKKIKLFNLELVIATALDNSESPNIYYGNIDSVISPVIKPDYPYLGYPIYGLLLGKDLSQYSYFANDVLYSEVRESTELDAKKILGNDPISIKYKETPHLIISLDKDKDNKLIILPSDSVYTEPLGQYFWESGEAPLYLDYLSETQTSIGSPTNPLEGEYWLVNGELIYKYSENTWVPLDRLFPNEVFYKGVYNNNFPTIYNTSKIPIPNRPYFKISITDSNIITSRVTRDIITSPIKDRIYVAELYKDINPYTNLSLKDFESFTWIPIGDFTSNFSNIIGDRGDTYYQRWDCLKTYPFALEDPNQVIDITSFMVESHINLDGRYDRRRYKDLTIDNTNFNRINPIYSQLDNFFLFNIVDLKDEYFPNQVMWSMPKLVGEEIDSWTNINPTNAIDLDGDKGEIQSLNRLNNEIYAFLDRGLCRIAFNSRAMITPSDGVPIEIANGGKVDGKIYISDNYGCSNKWSITESPNGIYFTDSNIKSIMVLNSQGISNLSDSKGMNSWSKYNVNFHDWNTIGFNNIRTLYNSYTGDVYFTTNREALSYNEKINEFTSFYSYNNVPWLFNILGNSYLIRNNSLWKMFSGEYCNFFGILNEFYINLVANPDFLLDKIIDTIEFRTNDVSTIKYSKANYYPFLRIEVFNEYQYGIGDTKNLKKKFRTWRWQLPRNNSGKFKRDRIRNPWAYIKMTCDANNSSRELLLYDMVVSYYI